MEKGEVWGRDRKEEEKVGEEAAEDPRVRVRAAATLCPPPVGRPPHGAALPHQPRPCAAGVRRALLCDLSTRGRATTWPRGKAPLNEDGPWHDEPARGR